MQTQTISSPKSTDATKDSFDNIKVLNPAEKPISQEQEEAVPNSYTFTGREYDPESGLYYYRARYYDPNIGRFLQEDPIKGILKKPQSLNLYPYASNNPINYTDPDESKRERS